MKERLVKISKFLLTTCMAFGAWVGCDIVSAIFFGEYEYPAEQ